LFRFCERAPALGTARDTDLDLAARVARLTAGQRACLDLVDDHATSKEIALRLNISRHTVDARLRQAIQTLGVTSRREAAIIWRAAASADGYQQFAYQPSQIVSESAPGVATSIELSGGTESDFDDAMGDEAERRDRAEPRPFAAGFAPFEGQRHDRHAPMALAGEVGEAVAWGEWTPDPPSPPVRSLKLWGGANDLTASQRMLGILIVTIVAMLAFGLLLSGIGALAQLRS
jgi:DNA-binding CsgD family transcriptional regulator